MQPDQVSDKADRELTEQLRIGGHPHFDGVTRGTVIEYDDWQWGVVTEIAQEQEPTMVGFVLIDELGDDVVRILESAWGCWEHYEAVESYRGGEHEYWTDVEYLTNGDIWTVLGPVHPDERSDDQEVSADATV